MEGLQIIKITIMYKSDVTLPITDISILHIIYNSHIQRRGELMSLLLFALNLHIVTSTIYYVIPDDHNYSYNKDVNYFTLQHYLNNTSKYFASNNQFHFMPGQYYISNDVIFKNINNFLFVGIDQCVITCTSPASVLIINVTSFIFQNIKLMSCIKSHKEYFKANITHFDRMYARNTVPFSKVTEYHASLFLYNSSSVTISNIDVTTTVTKSFTAILIMNVQNASNIADVKVEVSSLNCAGNDHPVRISGIVVYYSDSIAHRSTLTIKNLYYNNTYESCTNHFHCILTLLFLQNNEKRIEFDLNISRIEIYIKNSVFNNLKNSSILCYYGEAYDDSNLHSRSVVFQNSIISNNMGYHQLSMFYIVLKSLSPFSKSYFATNIASINLEKKRLYNTLTFRDCVITGNRDMKAVIYVKPSTTDTSVGRIVIYTSAFQKNKNVNFITVKKNYQTVWYVTTQIWLYDVNISSNEHSDGDSLILVTSGILSLFKVIFNQNKYYRTVISLQSSLLLFQTYTEITNNFARHIIKAQSRSFLFINVFKTINISHNVVYKTIKIVNTFEKNAVPICPFQGHHTQGYKIFQLQLKKVYFKLILFHNIEMISKILPTEIISVVYKNCTWLKGSLFQEMKTDANTIYNSIVKYNNNTFVNINTTKRVIPLTVCPCLNNSSYNCFKANVYSILPGQVLHVNLKVSPQWSDHHSTTLVATNTIDDDCSIVDGSQLSQTHFNNDCNRYSYTIWPNSESVAECKLFIGLSEIPEMFYVQIKPCPMGFTLNTNMKACSCDPLLNNDILSVTSCNINDTTILRPANSWISVKTSVNGSHSYDISSQCPFDYCLPHSSHLNLSYPNSQCQFNRSGVLCGECKQGLSAVFGSSQCKLCSNFYVFIIVPIAIAGIVLVIILFIFNLTVTNGVINTLIFYVNIISINYSQFGFDSHSPDCVILSLLNLDLGIETCFYDGMDAYVKTWLQLAFPSYLMIIAFALIIGSCYSSKLQRLTANRVLKVLATLFLLSFTKVLQTVCQVLFFFSTVTHVPSKQTSLLWSVDTRVAVFGVTFCILYGVCLILFITLLLFNAVLLFPRTLSRFRFVNYFMPLLDAYFGPYKPKYSFWTGLQLFIRSSFFGLSALSKNIGLSSGAVLVGITHCIHDVLHPFKSRYKNVQESLVLLNLLALHVTALYPDNNSFYRLFIIKALIIIVLVYFILLVLCHCAMLLCGDAIKRRANKILSKMTSVKHGCSKSLQMKELSSQIPDVSFNYKEFQEPLVALD